MKIAIVIASLLFLAACSSNTSLNSDVNQTKPQIGTMAWFELVETQYPTSDGQGHGPDYGSQEWCDVVYFKIHGQRSQTPVECDQKWFESIDKKL